MLKDFISQRFGRLVVIKERPDLKKSNNRIVECLCDCGESKAIRLDYLKNGHTQSCGCLQKELTIARSIKHGFRHLPEYNVWSMIKQRCYNEKRTDYSRYGGRRIAISDEWFNNFEAFYRDMGVKPAPSYTIERKNNDEGYSKNNCYWATRKEQANNRVTNVFYTHDGKTKHLPDWCKELELNYSIIYSRIRRGWCFEEAIKITKLSLDTHYEIEGVSKTFLEWCENSRLLFGTVRNRILNGWTFREALRPIEKEIFEFEGSKLTLYEWCCLMDLDQNTTYLRILRGEKLEDLINGKT